MKGNYLQLLDLSTSPSAKFGPRGLDRLWNDISIAMVSEHNVDVVGGHHVVEHTQSIALPGLK